MKSDSNGCSTCPQGRESFETFTIRGKVRVQYDYRTPDGELFTTIADSVEAARQKRDRWLALTGTQDTTVAAQNPAAEPAIFR